MIAETAFGVYVHWPFCAAKCPYCDFNSHVRHNPVNQAEFVTSYQIEISYMASLAPGRKVTSIFFGGGTPSLMDPATVETILEAINTRWKVAADVEITLEANPQSVDAGRFAEYARAGVNRVSLGVQSLDDAQLKFLGRLHTADEAKRAISVAREHFGRMSFDMIYARPGQTAQDWERELTAAIDLAADHLSLYQLTIEQGTPFHDLREMGRLNPLDEENSAQLYELTQEITTQAEMPAYEISNHARPGSECRHNLVYWRGQEYAGIGPGAHGRLKTDDGWLATSTLTMPEEWHRKVKAFGQGLAEKEALYREERADEMLLMGLRLAEGIDPVAHEKLCGQKLNKERILFLQSLGMVEWKDEGKLRVTPKGFLVLDAVVADLAADQG